MPTRRSTLKWPLLSVPALWTAHSGLSQAATPAAASVATPGRLSVRGTEILDPSGQPIMLRGWNWGHWNEILPQDAPENAAQGANCVRIPLRWWGKYRTKYIDSRDDNAKDTVGIAPANLEHLDKAIKNASDNKLWIVLFIDSDCGQNGMQPTNREYCDPGGKFGKEGHNFWTDKAARQQFFAVWRFIANRYKNTPYLGMFEPQPEPNPTDVSAAELKAFYAELMSNIRSVAPGVPFLIGPRKYQGKWLEEMYEPAWKDVVYTGNLFLRVKGRGTDDRGIEDFHKRVKELTDFRARHQVPVFCQQIGVRSRDDPTRRGIKEMMKVMVEARVGFVWWSYRGSGNEGDYSAVYTNGKEWVIKRDVMDTITATFKQR